MAGERTLPGLGLTGFWDLGSDFKTGMDQNLLVLSVRANGAVASRASAAPGTPANGDVHIATTDWGGTATAHSVQVRDNGAWVEITPQEGWLMYDQATDEPLIYTGLLWDVLETGAAGGGGTVVPAPFAHIRLSSDLAVNGTSLLTFDSVVEDASGAYDVANSAFIIPAGLDGKVAYMAVQTQHTADSTSSLELRIEQSDDGGATWDRVGQSPNAGADHFGIAAASALVRLVAGQRYRASVFTGTSKTVAASRSNFKLVVLEATDGTGTSGASGITLGTAITASRDLVNADFSGQVFFDVNSGSPVTLTVPPGLTGTEPVSFQAIGAGTVSFAAGAGVTIQSLGGSLAISGQYGAVSLVPKGSDVYALIGALA